MVSYPTLTVRVMFHFVVATIGVTARDPLARVIEILTSLFTVTTFDKVAFGTLG